MTPLAVLSACSQEDKGDLAAFCQLVGDGVGVLPQGSDGDATLLEELEQAAPKEVRPAAVTVRNASLELDEIEELDELFRQAFNLEQAVAEARRTLVSYAQRECGELFNYDQVIATDTRDNLQAYLAQYFSNEPWQGRIVFTVEVEDRRVVSVVGEYDDTLAEEGAVTACSVVVARLEEVDSVTIQSGGRVLASRSRPGEVCQQP